MNKLFLILISIILLIGSANATSVSTSAASGVTEKSVTMNGNLVLTDPSAQVWFEYSGNPGHYIFKTTSRTKSVSGDFDEDVSGLPLMSHQTFYYRSVAQVGSTYYKGAEQSFTMDDLVPISSVYHFDNHSQELLDAKLNPVNMTIISFEPYTDIMGNTFWGIIFGIIFGVLWLRKYDMTIPSLLGIITGILIWRLLPPVFVQAAYMILAISLAGIVYSLIKKRS